MHSAKQAANRAFDFSLDALDFKERLARELSAASARMTELEDEELDMLYAAGVADPQPEDDPFFN